MRAVLCPATVYVSALDGDAHAAAGACNLAHSGFDGVCGQVGHLAFGIYMLPSWVGIPLTVLIVVYITNAINLIDGIDGLASGLSCIALTVLAAICISNGSYFYALLALATLGILIPFWFYNVFGNAQRGHKLFMGDTGSLTIGYILSFLVIQLSVVHSDGEVRTKFM